MQRRADRDRPRRQCAGLADDPGAPGSGRPAGSSCARTSPSSTSPTTRRRTASSTRKASTSTPRAATSTRTTTAGSRTSTAASARSCSASDGDCRAGRRVTAPPGTAAMSIESTTVEMTEFEREVAGLVIEALRLEMRAGEFAVEAPLYGGELGLDSIDMLEIALAVSKRYGVEIAVRRCRHAAHLRLAAGPGRARRRASRALTRWARRSLRDRRPYAARRAPGQAGLLDRRRRGGRRGDPARGSTAGSTSSPSRSTWRLPRRSRGRCVPARSRWSRGSRSASAAGSSRNSSATRAR